MALGKMQQPCIFKWRFFKNALSYLYVTWGISLLFDLKLRTVRFKKRISNVLLCISPWRTHCSKGQIIEKTTKVREGAGGLISPQGHRKKGWEIDSLLFALSFSVRMVRVSQWDPNQVYLKGKNGRELIILINRNAEDTVNINHT